MITLTIDGKRITTSPGKTILEAAREGGIDIPTLCYHESLLPFGACRLCIVEVEGYSEPMTACTTPAAGRASSVTTRSERLFRMRREIIKLLLVSHPLDCPQCDKGGECRLQDLVYEHGIERAEYAADPRRRQGTLRHAAHPVLGAPVRPLRTVLPRLPRGVGPGRHRPRRERDLRRRSRRATATTASPAGSASRSARWAP